MPQPAKQTCGNCRFLIDTYTDEIPRCHRYPPQAAMEKCYAIIGRVAPLMDAFFGVPARKHTYSDINSFFVAHILYRC